MSLPFLLSQPLGLPINAVNILRDLIYLDPFNLDFAGLQQRIPVDFPDTPRSVVVLPQDTTISNGVIIAADNYVFILIGGTDGTQVPGLINAWANPSPNPLIARGANDWWQAAAQRFINAMPAGIPRNADYYLAGHSYGAATVEVIASWLLNNRIGNSLNVWTFGAPRPGTDVFQSRVSTLNLWRYFTDTDPVPEVPPHTPEAPILHFFLPNNLALGVNRQVQVGGGIRVDPMGNFTFTNDQTLPLSINEPSLLAWLVGSNCFQAQAHNPREYQRRLILSPVPPTSQLGPDRSPPLTAEEPVDISVRIIHQITDRAVASMEPSTLPPGLPAITPGSRKNRYTIRRHRGAWSVWYQGQIVSLCASKREARQVARAGNNANAVHDTLLPS